MNSLIAQQVQAARSRLRTRVTDAYAPAPTAAVPVSVRRVAIVSTASILAVGTGTYLAPAAQADSKGQTYFGQVCVLQNCIGRGEFSSLVRATGTQVFSAEADFFALAGVSNWKVVWRLFDTQGNLYHTEPSVYHSGLANRGKASWNPGSFAARDGKMCANLYENSDRIATVCQNISAGRGQTVANRKALRCLDADLNTIGREGARVQLWDCNRSRQQAWVFNSGGTITSLKSGQCLDADLNMISRNGTKVQLWSCNGSRQQQWNVYNDGRIINKFSGRCLDADLNTIGAIGTRIQLWDCNNSPQQEWG